MANPLKYIRKHPKLAKQLIGLTLPQLEQLIKQVSALDNQLKKEREKDKIRVNRKGAGRSQILCFRISYFGDPSL